MSMDDHQSPSSVYKLCVLFADVPENVESRQLCEILHGEKAVVIPSPNGDTRDKKWLVLFSSADEAEKFEQDSTTLIQIEGKDIEIRVDKPTPCDIPPEWIEMQPSQHHDDEFQHTGSNPHHPPRDQSPTNQDPQNPYYKLAQLHLNQQQNPSGTTNTDQQQTANAQQFPFGQAYGHPVPNERLPPGYYPYSGYPPPGYPPWIFYPPYAGYPKPPDGAAVGRGPPPPYNGVGIIAGEVTPNEGAQQIASVQGIPQLYPVDPNLRTNREQEGEGHMVTKVKGQKKTNNKEGKKSTTVIKVSKLPEGATEDSLMLFFENRRMFGGGNIEHVNFDKTTSTAFITFEEPEAVERVLDKLPVLFMDKKIEVSAYYPESSENSEDEEADDMEREVTPVLNKIEVRGVKPGTSDDTVLYYFENKRRSGGGDIRDLEREEDVIYITFEDENVLETVLKREHKIDGALLQVTRFTPAPPPKPRPTYTDKFFISGLNPDTTKDCLQLFLEARAKCCPEEIVYGEQEGTALITFGEETPDFEELKSVCEKRQLDGNFLSVSKVPVTNTVMVTGVRSSTTEDTLRFYFENTRRSGGSDVEDIKLNSQEETCFVSFQDPDVIYNVCKRSHKIDGQELNVRIYHECLGKASISSNVEGSTRPKFKIPESFTIYDDADGEKIKFLFETKTVYKEVEKNMESCNALINWSEEPCFITINCTLTTDDDHHRKLAKSWKKQVTDAINKFLDRVIVKHHAVLLEAWDLVLEGLKAMVITHPDGAVVSVKKEKREIIVAGFIHVANNVSKQLEDLVEKATKELERLKKETKDQQSLASYKLHLLKLKQFPESMKTKYPNLKMDIDFKNNQILFEGLVMEINSAKVVMFEMLQKLKDSVVGKFSQERLNFLDSEAVKDYLYTKFEEKQVCGVWEIAQDGTVTMYSLSDADNVKAAHILKESVVETPVSFRPESLELIKSPKWTNKKAEIEETYPGLVCLVPFLNQQQIMILSTTENAGVAREMVDDFITYNTVLTEVMSLPSGKFRYLQAHHRKDIETLSHDLKGQQGQVNVIDGKIQIKGTTRSMKLVKKGVQEILDKVEHRQHVFKKPGIVKYIQSEQGRDKIRQVEKTQRCVIETNEYENAEMDHGDGEVMEFKNILPKETEMGNVVVGTGQRIFAVCGDITELQGVDVIVNAANKSLDHMGGLAKVIVDKGGQSIQDECFAYVRSNKQLYEGDIFCGNPGTLKCKAIFHAVGPIYQNGRNKEEELLREVVLKALEEMERRRFYSIAIPALCSGVFGFPVTLATKVIVEALRDYFKQIRSSVIKDIYLCDVQQGNVRFFFQAMKKIFGSDKVQGKIQDPRSLAGWSPAGKRKGASKASGGHKKHQSEPVCNIDIEVIEGLISRQAVDVIVNTTSGNLQLTNGAVSSSLLNDGGPQLQQECSRNYPNGIQPGDVAITSGGQLKCQAVFHGALKEWSTGVPSKSLAIFRGFIDKCLQQAGSSNYNTVAFPALGTGNLGFPRDIAAKEMFQCVTDFSISHPASSITEVRFVVYDKDFPTVKAFRDEEKRWKSGGARQGRQFNPDAATASNIRGRDRREEDTDESLLQIGPLKLRVYQGDITQAQTDVIVNTTNSEFDLSRGAVAKAVAKAGGDFLKWQIDIHKKPFKSDIIEVTTAGPTMNCKYIIHLNAEDINKKWKAPIVKILEKSDELQCTSVAFPALGTGYAKDNAVKDVAEGLWDAMVKHKDSFKTLQEIHMVIFELEKFKNFMTEIHTMLHKELTKTPGFRKAVSGFIGGLVRQVTGDPKTGGKDKADVFKFLEPEVSSIVLMIYANSQTSIDDAIDAIDKQCEKDFTTNVIENEMIKEFTPTHVNDIKDLEREYGVDINLEIRIGRLRVHGPFQNVLDAATPVHNVIQAALKNKQAKDEAVYVSDLVQWSFIDINQKGKNLVPYPPTVNLILEKAYRSQKVEASFLDSDKKKFIVDLNNYVEYPADDPTDKVEVIRRDLLKDTKTEIPANWTPMKDAENVAVITLSPSDKEYRKVVQNFNQTSSGSYSITKIERIQNRMLYQQYLAKKNLMESQNTSGNQNENTLWHGTSASAVDSINTYGFNRSYCGRNATVYGNGVYFAVGSEYSARDQYAAPDHNGDKRMYQCKVLTGEYVQGSQGLRVPPQKVKQAKMLRKLGVFGGLQPPVAGSVEYYDSVVDSVQNPGIYVIFNDTQAYPEYLVTFQ